MKPRLLTLLFAAAVPPVVYGQTFGPTGAVTVSITVAAESAVSVDTATTLTSSGLFANYTGTTNLLYKVRTSKTTGTGTVTAQVTADFSGAGGPSVASPPTAGDTLSYTCTSAAPATACSGSQVASTSSATNVASFGADAHSGTSGNSGSVSWTLVNDPKYQTGTYSATITYTISAT